MNDALTINGVTVTIGDVARFAPVVHFHRSEKYFPCSIEFLLGGKTRLVLGDGQNLAATPDALFDARIDAGAYLRIDQALWGGMPSNNGKSPAPMYASVQVPHDKTFVDFNYFFLSAFNGPQAAQVEVPTLVQTITAFTIPSFTCAIDDFAKHQGDVEGISVRVTADLGRVIAVGFAAHGDFSYYLPQDLDFESGTHPVVSAGVFSHASYNARDASRFLDPGSFEVVLDKEEVGGAGIVFIDDIIGGGVEWRPFAQPGGVPSAALVLVGFDGSIDKPINDQKWTSFQGDLGEKRSNGFTDLERTRETIHAQWTTLVHTGEWFADLVGKIPDKLKEGAGPDGFGKRGDRLLLDRPSHVSLIVSRLNPLFVLAADAGQVTGDLMVTPLILGAPPSSAQEWTIVSRAPKGIHGALYNNASGLVAAVTKGSGVGTALKQVPSARVDEGSTWTSSDGSHNLVALRPLYNSDLNIRALGTSPTGSPVALRGWDGGQAYERWGVVNVVPGVSRPSLVAMYRSSEDDTLWWSVFDPATHSWYPDAQIGQGMSATSGPALAMGGSTLMSVYRGTDNQLWWTTLDVAARVWRRNQPFGQGMSTTAGPALAWLHGTFYCVHKGDADNELWWATFDEPAGRWNKDRQFGQGMSTSTAPALAVFDGVLYCVHKGNDDDQLWWTTFDASAGRWQKDQPFGQGMETQGVALAALAGVLYCVHRGTDDLLYWTTFDPAQKKWQKHTPFGLGMNSLAAPALAVTNGTLYCVHRGGTHERDIDDQLWWSAFDAKARQWPKDSAFNFNIRSQDAPAVVAVV